MEDLKFLVAERLTTEFSDLDVRFVKAYPFSKTVPVRWDSIEEKYWKSCEKLVNAGVLREDMPEFDLTVILLTEIGEQFREKILQFSNSLHYLQMQVGHLIKKETDKRNSKTVTVAIEIGTALQDTADFTINPTHVDTLANPQGNAPYPIGYYHGTQVLVDPNMRFDDRSVWFDNGETVDVWKELNYGKDVTIA